ncbi:MAG: branched-chain amino acid ABC transporter permease [Dehalococcoidia bacterium]|nr:branched-chain amino acid ABC transporter permease [Dehalococcoidia bacterium]
MTERIIIDGLLSSGVYAVLAVGFSLIFGVARIVNLAHTAFFMLAAYLIYTLTVTYGISTAAGVFIAIVSVVIVGMLSYKFLLSRVREHQMAIFIVTIALAIIIQEVLLISYGGHFRGVPSLVSGFTTFLGVKILYQHLLTFGAVLVLLVGTWLLLMRTKTGTAIRAVAQDREVANLMGIDVGRMEMITMAVSVALAAVAGALVAPLFTLTPSMWMHPLVMVLAVVVLGGLGSLKGSLAGALILGFAETLVVFLVPAGAFLKGSVALSIMLIAIMLRPSGLFGISFEEDR